MIAAGDVVELAHRHHAHPKIVGGLAVGIDRGAHAGTGVAGDGAFDEVALERRLADEVDDAAGRAAAEQDGGRPLVDLDRVDREGVARIPAGIAHAVAEDVALRREAADVGRVALVAALAGAEGDPGDVAQRVPHGGAHLLLDHLLGDDVDGLRRVEDRGRQPGQARRGGAVAAGAGGPGRCRRALRVGRRSRRWWSGWLRLRCRPRGLLAARRAGSLGLHRNGRERDIRLRCVLLGRSLLRRRLRRWLIGGWRLHGRRLGGRRLLGGGRRLVRRRLRLGIHGAAEIEQRRCADQAGAGLDGPLGLTSD